MNSIKEVDKLNTNAMQIFIHSPRNWRIRDIPDEEIRTFIKEVKIRDIFPLVVHASYLIHPLSKDFETVEKSFNLFILELQYANIIEADYYVIHIGDNSLLSNDERMRKVVNFFKCVQSITLGKTKILLENSANGFFSRFTQLVFLLKKLYFIGLGGICLDTAHTFQSGYDISTNKGVSQLLDELGDNELIKLIHLNDSKTKLGSGVDRHEHIGKGYIGLDGFKTLLSHPAFKGIPLILGTPRKSIEEDKNNLSIVKHILQDINLPK